MSDKDTILKQLDIIGVDAAFIIQEMFLGYKYRKHNGQLYNDDADIPTKLIKLYYELKPTEISFDDISRLKPDLCLILTYTKIIPTQFPSILQP